MKFTPLAALMLLLSCASTGATSVTTDAPRSTLPEPGVLGEVVERAVSVEGRSIEAYRVGTGAETVLFVGVVHGSEPIGQGLLARFLEVLKTTPRHLEGRTAVVVPVLNPDGLARQYRMNARGVDLNRNFPAKNFAASAKRGESPLSEPESRFLALLVEKYRPARIVTIHQPLRCINFDGPAGELAAQMAELSLFPLKSEIGYATPGSFGSWAGDDLGIAVVTLEHSDSKDVLQAWVQHGESLLLALRGVGAKVSRDE